MKNLLIGGYRFALFALLCPFVLNAQSTTVSVTVVDPSSQAWANGTISYVFMPAPSSPGPFYWQGAPIAANYLVPTTVNLDNTGSATFTIPTNVGFVTPSGSSWQYIICPNASVQCAVLGIPTVGNTQNISSTVTAGITNIVINVSNLPIAYSDAEVKLVPKNGAMYYNSTSSLIRFWNGITWANLGGGGSTGFPITLGATPIAASSTTPAVTGLSVNGVTLTNSLGTGAFLNGAGGYSSPSGGTIQIVYASVACAAYINSDPNLGGGLDGTACVNAYLALASPTNSVTFVIDKGTMLISGTGLLCPAGGNCTLTGNGAGLTSTGITGCGIASGVATFTTVTNQLIAGQGFTVKGLANCTALNGLTLTVLSSGLSPTGFKVNTTAGNVSTASENPQVAITQSVYGTGVFLAPGTQQDMFSNGHPFTGGACVISAGTPQSKGANINISNIFFNGNAANETSYCFGADIHDVNNVTVSNVVIYNLNKFGIIFTNVSNAYLNNITCAAANTGAAAPVNTDCVHLSGPDSDIHVNGATVSVSDDAFALNSVEGYCGPITRVTIDNVTLNNTFDMFRAYNVGAVCSNGLNPTIDAVLGNFTGTVYNQLGIFGLATNTTGTVGALNPTVSNFKINNSTVTSNSGVGFLVNENLGEISFSNDTFINSGFLFENYTSNIATTLDTLILSGVNFYRTAAQPTFNLLAVFAPATTFTINHLNVNGGGLYNSIGYSGTVQQGYIGTTGGLLGHISEVNYANVDSQWMTAPYNTTELGVTIPAQINGEQFASGYTVGGVGPNAPGTYSFNSIGCNLHSFWETDFPSWAQGWTVGLCVPGFAVTPNLHITTLPFGGPAWLDWLDIDAASGAVKISPKTVGALPAAGSVPAGSILTVTDATTFTPGACVGGGGDTMIAVSNGTSWSCH